MARTRRSPPDWRTMSAYNYARERAVLDHDPVAAPQVGPRNGFDARVKGAADGLKLRF